MEGFATRQSNHYEIRGHRRECRSPMTRQLQDAVCAIGEWGTSSERCSQSLITMLRESSSKLPKERRSRQTNMDEELDNVLA